MSERSGEQQSVTGAPRPGEDRSRFDRQELRAFLALEMGGRLGEDGDIAGLRLADLVADPDLKAMGLTLWRQMTARKPVAQRIEEAGLTVTDLFAPGMTEFVTTSSTAEELARYRQKLAFRADLLEKLLEETLAELENVDAMKPAAEPPATSAGADAGLDRAE